MSARSRTRLEPTLLAALLLACLSTVAPARGAETDPAMQAPAAESPTVKKRTYSGPGLNAFRAGHRAWELGDWDTALARMSAAAKADRDQPEAQVRLPGVFMSPYVPMFYKSHAQCQLGRCSEARRDMDDVLRLIKDAPSYLRNKYQKDCQKTCPRASP